MASYLDSVIKAYDKAEKAHDKASVTKSSEYKKKLKLADKRIEKALAEYNQIKEEAEASMDQKLREKMYRAAEKAEKLWIERDLIGIRNRKL